MMRFKIFYVTREITPLGAMAIIYFLFEKKKWNKLFLNFWRVGSLYISACQEYILQVCSFIHSVVCLTTGP
jgi:hypothetical protein